jgi:hypothetical protein
MVSCQVDVLILGSSVSKTSQASVPGQCDGDGQEMISCTCVYISINVSNPLHIMLEVLRIDNGKIDHNGYDAG